MVLDVRADEELGVVIVTVAGTEHELFPDEAEMWMDRIEEMVQSGEADELLMLRGRETGLTKEDYETITDVIAETRELAEEVRQDG